MMSFDSHTWCLAGWRSWRPLRRSRLCRKKRSETSRVRETGASEVESLTRLPSPALFLAPASSYGNRAVAAPQCLAPNANCRSVDVSLFVVKSNSDVTSSHNRFAAYWVAQKLRARSRPG